MPKDIIVIYANCNELESKGDFAWAAEIASDMQTLIESKHLDLEVVLASTVEHNGMGRFRQMFGNDGADGKRDVYGSRIRFEPIENNCDLMDRSKYNVRAFFEGNHCYYCKDHFLSKILNAHSKFAYVFNANSNIPHAQRDASIMLQILADDQKEALVKRAYRARNAIGMFVGGIGPEQDGFAAEALSPVATSASHVKPSRPYVYIYYNGRDGSSLAMLRQFLDIQKQCGGLSLSNAYYVVGDNQTFLSGFVDHVNVLQGNGASQINSPLEIDDAKYSGKPIVGHSKHLPMVENDALMRASERVTIATGVGSTRKALREGKVVWYQWLNNNSEFASGVTQAVCSYVLSSPVLEPSVKTSIAKGMTALFMPKPLQGQYIVDARAVLSSPTMMTALGDACSTVLQQSSGIGVRLLDWVLAAPSLPYHPASVTALEHKGLLSYAGLSPEERLTYVYKTAKDVGFPSLATAIRRGAAGHGSESDFIKLLEAATVNVISAPDETPGKGNTALHWAVKNSQHGRMRELLKRGADPEVRDANGNRPIDLPEVTSIVRGIFNVEAVKIQAASQKQLLKPFHDPAKDGGILPEMSMAIKRGAIGKGNLAEFKLLLEKASMHHFEDSDYGGTALALAAKMGQLDRVYAIIDASAGLALDATYWQAAADVAATASIRDRIELQIPQTPIAMQPNVSL